MSGFWADVPTDRVVHLRGASSAAVELALRPLPDDGPAIVTYFPDLPSSVPSAVAALLAELDALAVRLFPAWLPEADGIEASGGAAVRVLAMRKAAGAGYFGPFLADLAERALSGRRRRMQHLAAEVRAAGLVRVIAESFRRDRLVIAMYPPDDLSSDAVDILVAAGDWLVRHGDAGVWLTGGCWSAVDRVARITVQLSEEMTTIVAAAPDLSIRPAPPAVTFPAIRGRPRADSPAECSLEAALARQPWAHGRAWNETYQADPLCQPITVDLVWRAERCIVEIDGPEHRGPLQFEADRRRDVRLQLDGFAVLRFTNAQVLYELDLVLSQLEQFITSRREIMAERLTHA